MQTVAVSAAHATGTWVEAGAPVIALHVEVPQVEVVGLQVLVVPVVQKGVVGNGSALPAQPGACRVGLPPAMRLCLIAGCAAPSSTRYTQHSKLSKQPIPAGRCYDPCSSAWPALLCSCRHASDHVVKASMRAGARTARPHVIHPQQQDAAELSGKERERWPGGAHGTWPMTVSSSSLCFTRSCQSLF